MKCRLSVEYYTRAIDADPSLAYPWVCLGHNFRDHMNPAHDRHKAEYCYLRAMELDPEWFGPLKNYCAIYHRLNQGIESDMSLRAYMRWAAVDPAGRVSMGRWRYFGKALRRAGRDEDADRAEAQGNWLCEMHRVKQVLPIFVSARLRARLLGREAACSADVQNIRKWTKNESAKWTTPFGWERQLQKQRTRGTVLPALRAARCRGRLLESKPPVPGTRVEVQSYKTGAWFPGVVLDFDERFYTIELASGRVLRRIPLKRVRPARAGVVPASSPDKRTASNWQPLLPFFVSARLRARLLETRQPASGAHAEVQSYKTGDWFPGVVLDYDERFYTIELTSGRVLRRIPIRRVRPVGVVLTNSPDKHAASNWQPP